MRSFVAAAALALASPAFSYTVTYKLTYDNVYDNGHESLKHVACSTGEHGLITEGYTTFDSIPSFPHIGGAPQIVGWNSLYCGSCWELTYTDARGVSTSLNITAIDSSDHSEEFNISLEAMNLLTNGHAKKLHEVSISAVRKPKSACGL